MDASARAIAFQETRGLQNAVSIQRGTLQLGVVVATVTLVEHRADMGRTGLISDTFPVSP